MKEILNDEEFFEVIEKGEGYIYNDFSGQGKSGNLYNILHSANCP